MGMVLRFRGISQSMDICSVEYNSQFLVKAGRLEMTSGAHSSCLSSWSQKFSCKGSPDCGIAVPDASHSHLAASQGLSASPGTSGTKPPPATGSETTPDSTAERDPWGQAANILKLHKKWKPLPLVQAVEDLLNFLAPEITPTHLCFSRIPLE